MSLRRYTTFNFLGSVVPLCLIFFTVPIYLDLVGEVRYGALAIIWIMLGYFSLFDFGLSRAVAQQVAKIDVQNIRETAAVFWSGLTIAAMLGAAGGLLLWPVAQFSSHLFSLDDVVQNEFSAAAPWLALAVPILTISSVFSGALQARNRFAELNLISVIGTLLFQVAPIVAALQFGPDLSILVPVALAARLIALTALFLACKRNVFKNQYARVNLTLAKRLMSFGGWVAVSSIVGPMMVILDRYVIGILGGAQSVSYYSVPFQLAERSTILARSLSSAIFPKLASDDAKEAGNLLRRSLLLITAFITPLSLIGIYILPAFLSWWIGGSFAALAAFPGQILIIGFWFNSLARLPHAKVQADGKPDKIALCHLAEVLPYLGILYVGLQYFGLAGAAAAFSIRAAADHIALSHFAGALSSSWRSLTLYACILLSALLFSFLSPPSPTLWMLVCGAQCLCIMFLALPAIRSSWNTNSINP